jgi:hypothetical protein
MIHKELSHLQILVQWMLVLRLEAPKLKPAVYCSETEKNCSSSSGGAMIPCPDFKDAGSKFCRFFL